MKKGIVIGVNDPWFFCTMIFDFSFCHSKRRVPYRASEGLGRGAEAVSEASGGGGGPLER